jgi:hypothetical protein
VRARENATKENNIFIFIAASFSLLTARGAFETVTQVCGLASILLMAIMMLKASKLRDKKTNTCLNLFHKIAVHSFVFH